MPFNFGEEPVNAGEMTSAQCSVNKGDMPLQIEWYLNENKIINQKNGIIFTRTTNRISVLSIESISAEHGGSFTCVATNKAGTTNHTSMLIVNGTQWLVYVVILFLFSIPSILPTLTG